MTMAQMIRSTAVVLALLAGAGAAGAQDASDSPYDRLQRNREAMMQRLSELEMTELLDAYHQRAAEAGDSEASIRYMVGRNLLLANQAANEADRERLMNQAIADLRGLIEAGADPDVGDFDAVMAHNSDRLRLAQVLGREKPDPYVLRLIYLQGADADKQAVLATTGEALEILEDLRRDAEDWLDRVQRDPDLRWDMMITGAIQRMEFFLDQVRYQSAWVSFNRSLAMDPQLMPGDPAEVEQRRRRLLQDAISNVIEYAEGDPDSGVKWWSLLLCGTASAELGEYDNAVSYLNRLNDPQADRVVRTRAAYELGKLFIARRQWTQATGQLESFRQSAQGMEEIARAGVDLQAAFLENHLYRQRAAEARGNGDAAAAQQFEQRAQQAFVDYLEQYPQYQRVLLRLIVGAYQDVDDPAELSTLVLVGKGLFAMPSDEGPGRPEEAMRFLRIAAERDDPAAEMLRPLAMLNLAWLLNEQGDWREAAQRFRHVAENYPEHPQAKVAAMSAVRVLDQGVRSGDGVSSDDMSAYAEALETLLSNEQWFEDPNVRRYSFNLARLLSRTGQNERALEWYIRVPQDSSDYWAARYFAMETERKILRRMDPGLLSASARRDKANDLVRRMRLYVDQAARAADDLTEPRRSNLLALGGQTDLMIAEVLKDELDQPAPALAHLQGVGDRWPDQPELAERAQALEVGLLIEQDRLQQAIEILQSMPAERAQTLVTFLVASIRDRIDQLERRNDPRSREELQARRQDYRRFAEQAFEVVRDEPAEQQYPFRQMLAEALTETGEPARALEMFQQLHQARPSDARNLHGIARASWLLEDYDTALLTYRELIQGLDRNNESHQSLYWKSQLESMQCAAEAFWDDVSNLRRLRTRYRQLRNYDASFGGLEGQFNFLLSRIEDRIEQLPPAGN